MANDYFDIAATVAAIISSGTYSKTPASVTVTYDDDITDTTSTNPTIRVRTISNTETRQTRTEWSRDCETQIVIYGAVISRDARDVDPWFQFVDEIIDQIKLLPPLTNPVTAITNVPRYDAGQLRTNDLFYTVLTLQYRLI